MNGLQKHLRQLIYTHYGNCCECCGLTDSRFFTLDHVNSDGKQHREWMREHGYSIERYVITHNFPDTIRILCVNCNYGRQWNGGTCPHKLPEQLETAENTFCLFCWCPTEVVLKTPYSPCSTCVENGIVDFKKPDKPERKVKQEKPTHKTCELCAKSLLLIKFKQDEQSILGVSPYCRDCSKKRLDRFYTKHPKAILKDVIQHRTPLRPPVTFSKLETP